jgi:hypothetical protein
MKSLLLAFASLFIAATAQAQWKTTTYTLKGGWNAIYLPGDATHGTLDSLLPASVLEVWRWNPNPTQVGFTESPLIPSSGTAEWSVWKRGVPAESSLTQLIGQMAYLVKCSGTASNTYSVPLKQSPQLPANSWVRNGANLLGFPTYKNGSLYPTMSSYFATFPAAIAANAKVYKYVGGDLGAGNPVQIFSTSLERLDATQAYWFSAEVTGNFYAPLEISPSSNDGLAFGRDGSFIKVLVRNRSAAAVTLTLTPVDSESAPSSMTGIVGKVPLTKRSFNAITKVWIETPITASYTEAIGPSSTVELIFGINRGDALMTAAAPDALFASLLRITDSSNLMEVDVPATAQASSLAGLWIGDVSLTNVSNKVSNGAQATATLTDGVITGLTVVGSGGFGYTSPPTVTLAPPHANSNTTATATAAVGSGALTGITPVAGGSGYASPPSVSVSPPTDTATATANASLVNGRVTGITLAQAGGFYTTTAPTITIEPPPASVTATASATVGLDKTLSGISVNNGGYYYDTAPAVTVDPPTLDTATATAVMTGDTVTGIQINSSGSNYSTAPTVIIAPQPSAQATAIAALSPTKTIAGITPVTGGGYYTVAPTVVISAPDAAAPPTLVVQATATAVLTQGAVTSYRITNAGSNYLNAPTVTITGGTFKTPVQATASSSLSQPTAVAGGAVNSVVVGALPTVYSEMPTVTVADPPDSVTATATATVLGGAVSSLAITAGGSNYADVPLVVLSGGTGATATAALGLTAQSFTFTPGTQAYSTAPSVTISGGGATTAATATVVLSGGASGTVTGIVLVTPGAGYTSAPTFTLSGGVINSVGTLATAVGNAQQFTVSQLTLVNGGAGFSTAAVSIDNPPAAQAATATAVLSGGEYGTVTRITLTSPGTGYLSPPDVSISAPDTETVTVVSDGIGSFSLSAGGAGYTSPPVVTLSNPPAGTQATATAILANGRVTGINLIDSGSRYSSAPLVTIADPPAPVQATASCVLTAGTSGTAAKGVSSGITVIQAGRGYLSAPTVAFSDPPNLVPAAATAILTNGAVTGYTINAAGSG